MRSTHRSPLSLLLALLGAVALLLSACGDDGGVEESDPPDTVEEEADDAFVEQLDELCAAGRAASDEAADDLNAALEDVGQADTDGDEAAYAEALDEAETAAEGLIDALDDFLTDVEEVEVPSELQGDLDDYVELREEQLPLYTELRDAIAADDGDAFTAVTEEIQSSEDEFDERALAAAEALGAAECEPESDGGSGDSDDDSSSDDSDDSGSDGGDDAEVFDPDAS